MLFDTHAHLDHSAFDDDLESLISQFPSAGVGHVLVPGTCVKSSEKACAIANSHAGFYFSAGIHPGSIEGVSHEDLDCIIVLAEDPKCVAIGEIGLDFHYGPPEVRDAQRYWFYQQLHLASELNLPVIVHDREAHKECFDAVSRFGVHGVFHCYSSSAEMAAELVKIGFYCSFTGVVTYRDARRALLAIEKLPLDRILIETDSPYLAPAPNTKDRNDPRNVLAVAEVISHVKGIPLETVISATEENAARLFRIRL